jgi:serine protease AprX
MKLLNSSVFLVVVSAIAAIAVSNYSNNSVVQVGATKEAATKTVKSYILQGATSERLNQLVKGVGGNVSREFPIINAVSAWLTSSQADKIREVNGIRIQDDRTVITSSLLSKIASAFSMNNHIAEQTNADKLHDIDIKGQGVTVAVLDSGTNMGGTIGQYLFRDSNNQQRVSVKYDAFQGRETYYYNDDQNGHGSHVSGLIASSLKDTSGKYNGIAPDVYLLSVKAFNSRGQSSYSKVLDSLNWIFENRYKYKIRVVNMSLGADARGYYWNDPINQAVMRLWDAGIVIVSSAGNNGKEMGITVPGNTPYIITVGAATDSGTPLNDLDDRLASFSARGPTYEGFVKPDVIAYGARISSKLDERYLLRLFGLSTAASNYTEISGTSQAAAIVSGVAALIISNNPTASPDDVKCRIMTTAKRASNGKIATYSPFEQGSGLVNAYDAVMSSATNCANNSINIKEELMGLNHFIGPARIDSKGEYYIKLRDGGILTKGMHWGDGDLGLKGMHWGDADLGLEGMHWSDADLGLKGMYWGGADLSLEGMYWGGEEMSVKGMYWGDGALNVQGMYWSGEEMNLQSADLDLEPIDPNTIVPIKENGWR